MIIKIFLLGAVAGVLAFLLEKGMQKGITLIGSFFAFSSLVIFFISGFIEEGMKWLVVKWGLSKTGEPDEPVDGMLYMIICALGFAALENIAIAANTFVNYSIWQLSGILLMRFLLPTFLHALCSGVLGYFWVLAMQKNRSFYGALGFVGVSLLHSSYNWFIMQTAGQKGKILLPVVILIFLSLVVSYGFQHLKKIKNVCKIK